MSEETQSQGEIYETPQMLFHERHRSNESLEIEIINLIIEEKSKEKRSRILD